MSFTVHPSDRANLPARVGTATLAPRIPTHRQIIASKACQEAAKAGLWTFELHHRSRCIFHTAKVVGQDAAPVAFWNAIESARQRKASK